MILNKEDYKGIHRRLGRFSISRHLVRRYPHIAACVLTDHIVVDCRQRFDTDAFEYVTMYKEFEHVQDGACAPLYEVTVMEDQIDASKDNVCVNITWRRVQEEKG